MFPHSSERPLCFLIARLQGQHLFTSNDRCDAFMATLTLTPWPRLWRGMWKKSADPGRRAQFFSLCRIQNLSQNAKSEIQNLKSEIQKPKIRWGPHKKNCYITIQNPKSKIPKIRPKSLDFGFWIGEFLIPDFWTADFGFWGGPGDVPL